jgi:hypothetical protein
MRILKIAVALAVLAAAARAEAGNAEKCAAAKMKAASKYAACRLGADAKAKATGDPVDYTKCNDGQSNSWTKAEGKYTTDCPTTGDQATVQADLVAATSCVATELAGPTGSCSTSAEFLCGNGVVDPGEVCDQSDLDGATCNSATSGAKLFGALDCAADCKAFDTSGCIRCPANGVVVDGQCWILGNPGDSCTAACALQSMATSDATLQMLAPTASRCGWILSKLGANGYAPGVIVNGPTEIGCWLQSPGYVRVAYSSTQQGSHSGSARLCACQ